jgi:hypothetical protein
MNTGRPAYNFRILPEIGFAVFIAVLIAGAELLLGFDESIFDGDREAWIRFAIGTLARAVGGGIMTALTKGAFLGPGQSPAVHTTG